MLLDRNISNGTKGTEKVTQNLFCNQKVILIK